MFFIYTSVCATLSFHAVYDVLCHRVDEVLQT